MRPCKRTWKALIASRFADCSMRPQGLPNYKNRNTSTFTNANYVKAFFIFSSGYIATSRLPPQPKRPPQPELPRGEVEAAYFAHNVPPNTKRTYEGPP